jgi:hypothetical protein
VHESPIGTFRKCPARWLSWEGIISSQGSAPAQRFSGVSQPRQCGDDVLRMFVTGGPPVRGGGGIPQRIRTSCRSVPALRTIGAG